MATAVIAAMPRQSARGDLAAWLVAQLDNSDYVHRAVTLATS